MRKTTQIIFLISLIFGFSLPFHAQSTNEGLDQKELTKQFIGNWVADWANGTITRWNVTPLGNGYETSLYWEIDGQSTRTDKGVIGFSGDGLITMVYIWSQDGIITSDYGKFVTRNVLTVDRYDSLHGKSGAKFEFEFINPEKMKMVWTRWGQEGSPDDAEVTELIWTKE